MTVCKINCYRPACCCYSSLCGFLPWACWDVEYLLCSGLAGTCTLRRHSTVHTFLPLLWGWFERIAMLCVGQLVPEEDTATQYPRTNMATKFLTLSNQMASSLFSEYFMVGLVDSSIYCLTWATLILQMKGYWNQAWRDRLECNVNEGYNVVHVHTKNRKKQPTYFCISLPTTVRI